MKFEHLSKGFILLSILLVVSIFLFSAGWFYSVVTENACSVCQLKGGNSFLDQNKEQGDGELNPQNILDGNFIKHEDGAIYLDSEKGDKKITITDSTLYTELIKESPQAQESQTKDIDISDLEPGDSLSIFLKEDSDDLVAERVSKIIIKTN
jgi:hypothetical protein